MSRAIICALHHEARHRKIPMTRLMEQLLRKSLHGLPGWLEAAREWPELEGSQGGPPRQAKRESA